MVIKNKNLKQCFNVLIQSRVFYIFFYLRYNILSKIFFLQKTFFVMYFENEDNNRGEMDLDEGYEFLGLSEDYYRHHWSVYDDNDQYENLDVKKTSDIKNRYYKLALQYHPDRYVNNTNKDEKKKAEEMFKKLSSAYRVVLHDVEQLQKKAEKKKEEHNNYSEEEKNIFFGITKRNENSNLNNRNHSYYVKKRNNNKKKKKKCENNNKKDNNNNNTYTNICPYNDGDIQDDNSTKIFNKRKRRKNKRK